MSSIGSELTAGQASRTDAKEIYRAAPPKETNPSTDTRTQEVARRSLVSEVPEDAWGPHTHKRAY